MKFLANRSFPGMLAALAGALFAGGCAGNPLLTPQTQTVAQPVQVQYVTNEFQREVVTTVTNGVTVTNTITVTNPVTMTAWQTNLVTVTNGYAVSSTASNVLGGLSTVNTLTSGIDPFSGLVTGLLGLATAGLGFYARSKTTALQQQQSAAQTIITAVEGLEPATASAVKAAVAAQSAKMGTAAEVNSVVNAVTQNLP